MSHQDLNRHTGRQPNHQDLKRVLDWLTEGADFSTIHFAKTCTWTPRTLTITALLWVWSDKETLKDRFQAARKIAIHALALSMLVAATYQAFLQMLRAWTTRLAVPLVGALRRRMQEDLADRFTLDGYTLFGVDGTRLELPRTESNETPPVPRRPRRARKRPSKSKRRARAAAVARGTKSNTAQMWLTTLWHVGTGLPWDWRTGPSDSSERDHFKAMIAALPARAMVLADAGFVGYVYWKALLESGHQFLIRVGANVRLLKQLGYARERNGLVYLWPDRVRKQQQPPLVLRLVVAHDGREPVYLVTSVLDEGAFPDRQAIRAYGLRWGVELFYRHFKQTFARRKLRSRRWENAEVEAVWSLLGLWTMSLHAQVELSYDAVPSDQISVAKLLGAYRGAMAEYRSIALPGESLWERLAVAVLDGYERGNKTSRDFPRKKRARTAGAPEIRRATRLEVEAARQIKYDQLSALPA
jgi:hypothetical protein